MRLANAVVQALKRAHGMHNTDANMKTGVALRCIASKHPATRLHSVTHTNIHTPL